MVDRQYQPFQLSFNASPKVDFQGSPVTSDGGLIVVREVDEAPTGGAKVEFYAGELFSRVGFIVGNLWRRLVLQIAALPLLTGWGRRRANEQVEGRRGAEECTRNHLKLRSA